MEDYLYKHLLFFTAEGERTNAKKLLEHLGMEVINTEEDDNREDSETPLFELSFCTATRISVRTELDFIRNARPKTYILNRSE